MSNLKHPHIFVLELNRIVTPSKARLAFINSTNNCEVFHCYCKFCGVKLKPRNFKIKELHEKNQQPSCSDWNGVKHKQNCPSLKHNTSGGTSTSGGGVNPVIDDIFIPQYLTFERPNFVITQPSVIPEEIDIATLKIAPVDFNITELTHPNATYLLSDVIKAYKWITLQKFNDDNSPRIQLGMNTFSNRYTKLVKSLDKMSNPKGNPVIYFGTFNLRYTLINDDTLSLHSNEKIAFNKEKGTCRLNIIINRSDCLNTALDREIDSLKSIKSEKKLNSTCKFYIIGHNLPALPSKKINNQGGEYCEYVIEITNPYLIILTPLEKDEM